MESIISFPLTRNELSATTQLLGSGHRLDKRDFFEPRPIHVSMKEGSAIVHLGKTIVSCYTTVTEEVPSEDRPNEGIFSLNITSPYKMDIPFKVEAIRSIKAAFLKTKALDLESLIIKIGVSCYHLNSELVILENDGGLLDCSTIALAMSLLSTHVSGTRGPRAVILHHLPLSVTFSIFNPEIVLVDPTLYEAAVSNGTISIFANINGFVCGFSKNGGSPLPQEAIVALMEHAINVVSTWHLKLIEQMGDNAPLNLKILCKQNNQKKLVSNETETQEEIKESQEENPNKDDNQKEEEEAADIDPDLAAFLGI